jgi:tetratricopeptide (TPR) repeat protein
MKRIFSCLFGLIVCLSFVIASLYPCAALAEKCEEWVGKVVSVEGTVEVRRVGETQWQTVRLNDTYCPGDVIRVQERSRADVALVNQPVLRLDQNTTITLGGVKEERTSVIELARGAAHFFSRVRRNLEVLTAFVNAGVEGTEFFIRVEENQTFMSIFEGKVLAWNEVGRLMLVSGQAAVAETGKAPVLRVVVRPRDAVHWALYYPPVIYVPPEEAPKEDTSDPRFLAHRASLLLAVGRVDEAAKDIERALTLDPNYSDAFALQSIIAVVQNEKERALNLAQKAVETGPNSATARIALSYAQQASFDLKGARASLEEAVKLEPENALAWARLAELWSSFGNLNKALKAAKKAVALNPNLSRTQTVLGFAYLTKVKTKDARAAFEKAIELDQADPLPRLGLGLARIRESDLHEGRREIEIAASLDPNNSLIRSYLGKAYFEEKRTKLDGPQYEIAKELDPKDPTPWFYDAIRKQTVNRPVEALHDLQKAIELNDNRAVYRSKLLLDSDLAARSASLARIYGDLGFEQRALVEGWQSVNTDPTNYSAHRFLADTYAVLPRHEIARVSELLQSQLLQPINITPIQPALAESNLFLISAGGAADLSFREFNPLFNRDRVALQASGLYGENDTWAGEGIVSGIYKKLSFSAGYTHFATDGFRVNNDQEDDIANVFAQLELTPKTSIQGEYRYRDNERGDTQLRFFEDDFRPDRRHELETTTFRLGFRHAFSPRSNLIGNFAYQEYEDGVVDFGFIDPADVGVPLPPPPPFLREDIGLETKHDGFSGELSHLFRSQYVNTVAGAGYFKIDQEVILDRLGTYPGNPPFGIPPITFFDTTTKTDSDIDHINIYLYSYIKPLENLTLTVGASGDFFEFDEKESDANDLDEDQFNPKFGIVWNPLPNTTLRVAAFRTLKRTLTTNQTLEPTQVAGFNQFFDDFNATEARVYGAAVDQKFSQSIYGGAEFSYRDMEVPWFDLPDFPAPQVPQLKEADWKEYIGRVYLYWTPHRWFALKGEYRYEKFERDPEFNFSVEEVKTNSFPLGINFFHPSGLSAFFGATYYDQEGKFMREGPIPVPYEEGKDDFWVADAAINYRLPKRYGFITVGATNLFDKEFEYADTDILNPRIQPDRFFFAKVTLAIP